jgi:hypothetical protein
MVEILSFANYDNRDTVGYVPEIVPTPCAIITIHFAGVV